MKKLVVLISSLFLAGCQQESEPKKELTIYESTSDIVIYPDDQFILDENEKEYFIHLYKEALKSYQWFTFSTMDVDMSHPLVSDRQEDQGYFAVRGEKFSNMADLKNYLSQLFIPSIVDNLLNNTDLYKEVNGQLYAITADRGSNLSKGDGQEIKVIKKDENHYILRLELDLVDVENRMNLVGIEIIDYPLAKTNEQWLFTEFTNPR